MTTRYQFNLMDVLLLFLVVSLVVSWSVDRNSLTNRLSNAEKLNEMLGEEVIQLDFGAPKPYRIHQVGDEADLLARGTMSAVLLYQFLKCFRMHKADDSIHWVRYGSILLRYLDCKNLRQFRTRIVDLGLDVSFFELPNPKKKSRFRSFFSKTKNMKLPFD